MYLVAWTGGYDPPDFFISKDKNTAIAKAKDWFTQMDSRSLDIVQVFVLGDDESMELIWDDVAYGEGDFIC